MNARALVLAAGLLLLLGPAAFPQEHPNVARGLGAAGSFAGGDIDTVNLFNGNLVLRLPVGQAYPVNAGFTYQLSLVYNSQVWEHQTYDTETVAVPTRGANAGLGWSLHMGRLNPRLPNPPPPAPAYSRNTWMAPDGSTHTFYPTLHEGESAVAGVEYTRDGSYLRLNIANRQIEFPDGTIHTFSALDNGYLTKIEDRFGNYVQVAYLDCPAAPCEPAKARLWRISDRLGRTHEVSLRETGQPDQPLVVTKVDLQAFGGRRAIYKLLYNDSTDDQSTTGAPVGLTGCGGDIGSNHVTWFLTRIVLPDGSLYEIPKAAYFSYNVPGDVTTTPCKTGLINRLRLPTLGQIEWDYILYKFPSSSTNRNLWQRSTGVGFRRLLNSASVSIGQWVYTTALSGGTTAHETLLTNSVSDPLGNKVVRYFSVCVQNCSHPDGPYEYGLPVGREVEGDGTGRFISSRTYDSLGNLLRTSYVRYEHDLPSTFSLVEDKSRLNQRLASQRTVFHDDGGTYADEDLAHFDGLGHYRRRQTGGNFPGNNVRTSRVEYNSGIGNYGQVGYIPWPASAPWIINNWLFAWDNENGFIQYRIACFDTAKGVLLRHRVLKNSGSAESASDLLQVFQRNDGMGNVTGELYYGGDTQNLGVNACAMALPAAPAYQYSHVYSGGVRSRTNVTVSGSTLNTLNLTIDASTGLPSASRDIAGKPTNFTYDNLGRLTTADPADDLLTAYNYCTATSTTACPNGVRGQVIAARRATANGADETATRSRFDDWGRLISEEERMPPLGTFASRSFSYNALGWRTFASEQGVAAGTTFQDFDAFGRPRIIVPPDGAAHKVTVSYSGIRQVSRTVKVATAAGVETDAQTTEIYDRHGRLYEVTEPNGVKTRYGYDVGNRLSKVCQGATGTGTASCGQERLFNYDHRGFLISEKHPEKSGDGFVRYYNYDARGHVGRKLDGPNDLTFTWDKAERLTQVRETGGLQRVLKSFTYGTSILTDAFGVTDWRKGKVVSASRFNYVPAFNAKAEVRDTYVYKGAEGRASEHSRQLIFNDMEKEKFTTAYAYDGLGLVSTLSYPDCVTGLCAASDSSRTVTFNYSEGHLVSVPGYTGTAGGVSQITYHPNGLVHQVPHANGVLYTQQNDPNGMVRPSNMTATRGAATLWAAGSHTYDGAGNVKATGPQSYLYDSLSRIRQSTISGVVQSYTYDNFGNLQSLTTGGSVLSTPTSSATNRLTGAFYDNAGNMTSWSGNAYQYDAFNQMSRYTSGAEDWVYIYGPDDERFWSYRTAGGGSLWTLRDLSGMVLRRYDSHQGWGTYQDYIYRGSLLLASHFSNGQQRHYDVDHLGTPRLITDAAGNQVGFHTYYPYGREQTALQEGDRLKFTGHERDLANVAGDGDDLDYMHARHYSMVTGRFLSVDPVGGEAGDPQSWNGYTYVMGRALTYTDPSGLIGVRYYPPVGMTADDIAFSMAGFITVTATAWRGTTSNPYTGVVGLGSLINASNFMATITIILDDHRSRMNEMRAFIGWGIDWYNKQWEYEGDCFVFEGREGCMFIGMAPMPGGGSFGNTPASQLIRASLKKSPSYREELAHLSHAQLVKLAKGKGPVARAAKGMKKLIEGEKRLMKKGDK